MCLLLAVATNFRWTSAQPEQSSEQADTKGLFSFGSSSDQANDNQDDPGHTFSYEFLSPQKILTGCSGTKYANGDVKRVYYFVDATGKKKFIFPHKAVEVVFPSPAGLPGLTRSQKVHMSEMCFPTPCNVQGVCSPGSTIGPTGWSLPKCKLMTIMSLILSPCVVQARCVTISCSSLLQFLGFLGAMVGNKVFIPSISLRMDLQKRH